MAVRAGAEAGIRAGGDFAVAAWLWFAHEQFCTAGGTSIRSVLAVAMVIAAWSAAWRIGPVAASGAGLWSLRLIGLAGTLFLTGLITSRLHLVGLDWSSDAWMSGVAVALVAGSRQLTFREGRLDRPELARWLLLGATAVGVMFPFYTPRTIGAGDAVWYTLMLADTTTQLRAGVFPVWVGQSTYAFNGAVMPIRYAPGFQYFGGFLDLLTAHALHPTELKNLELVIAALLGIGSAYLCLGRIIPQRRWAAAVLAAAWVIGPGVLAPVMVGDQYMTFVSLPFFPVALYGCWRLANDDSLIGPLVAALGLAATWLCHPPIAFWTSLIAFAIGVYGFFAMPSRRWLRATVFAGTFALLGSYPFVSVFTLENRFHDDPPGLVAAEQVESVFPTNFRPIEAATPGIASYQLGYFLVAVWLATLVGSLFSRGRGYRPLLAATIVLVPITIPVPWLTRAFWGHSPAWFVSINNVWPMLRIFFVWSGLIVFAAAALLRFWPPRPAGRLASIGMALAVGLALVWPIREALKLERAVARTLSTLAATRLWESPEDSILSRYAYNALEFTPGYASHGYVDPWFENRLLDRASQKVILANADAAGPAPGVAKPSAVQTRLIATGGIRAKNIPPSDYYMLGPTVTIIGGHHYALRLALEPPGIAGTYQFAPPGLFREYLLPDSGAGMFRHGSSRAFGTLPKSSHVISITDATTQANIPLGLLITPRTPPADFDAGTYWLYDYDRSTLPIAVESWIPYRAKVSAPAESYLETPRVWLSGWRANVNGHAVRPRRSYQNLVMVRVGGGQSVVELTYQPSWPLALSFWTSLAGWLLILSVGVGYRFMTNSYRAAIN